MGPADIAIIASAQDKAGMNIAENLKLIQKFPAVIGQSRVVLEIAEEKITESEAACSRINAELFIFASKHVSKAGVHSLTVHSIGNFGDSVGGGKSGMLVPAPAGLMKRCLQILEAKARQEKMDYEVMQEATHHGPFIEKPAMFIEIGSDEERWTDLMAGKLVAETMLEAIRDYGNKEVKTAVGIGGTHYCTNLKKIILGEEFALGFVCPKHNLGALDESMLRQAAEKTMPKAGTAVIDWKGLGQEKARIVKLLESMGMPYRRTRDF